MEPSVLLADEPTGNLDRATATGVVDLLLSLNRARGLSLLMVTHNDQVASRLHRVIRIDDGRIAS
jgi:predicted ABC-type transport system involved in lysophospholipase L1 biosynthesis ATPase subunit